MSNPLILAIADADETFYVHTYALKYALGTFLMQKNENEKLVTVRYARRSLRKSEQMYSTFKEGAAAVLLP